MRTQQKRTIASLWPSRKFESFREAIRHSNIGGRRVQPQLSRRPLLTPAVPHSKAYGH
jgi:hypothetical protein